MLPGRWETVFRRSRWGPVEPRIAIAAGGEHTSAMLDDQTVKCWGDNSPYGKLGLGDGVDRGDNLGEMGDSLPAVALAAVSVATGSLPAGQVAVGYSAGLSATPGVAPFSWSVSSGTLPPGVSLSGAGVFSGTPTTAGTYNFVVEVSDSNTPVGTATQALSITVAPPVVTVATGSLPAGQVAVGYSAGLSATPGVAPFSWSVSSGTLPPGVSLSGAGVFSGTPTTAGTYNFVVEVSDSNTPVGTATQALSITVAPGVFRITTPSALPGATLGAAYSKALVAADGIPPYKWKKITKPPKGLKLNAKTGVISGVPKKLTGTFSFTVQARYRTKAPKQPAVWHIATKTFTIVVS